MAQIGQLPIGIFDEGGKFEPKQEFIDAARAKALEEGKKYIGDATGFEKFKDALFDIPDATIALVSGTGETLSEFALGLAKETLKGAQLSTTTDLKKIKEIREKPGFTSYFDQLNFPRTDIYDSKISGVTPTDLAEFTGKYIAPLPAGPLVTGAKIATTPVLKGIGQLSDDIIKSFIKGDSGFRASAGGKKGSYIRKTDKIQKYNVMKDKVNDIYSNPSKYNLKEGEVTNVNVLKIVNKHLNDMKLDSSSESAVNRVLVNLRGTTKKSNLKRKYPLERANRQVEKYFKQKYKNLTEDEIKALLEQSRIEFSQNFSPKDGVYSKKDINQVINLLEDTELLPSQFGKDPYFGQYLYDRALNKLNYLLTGEKRNIGHTRGTAEDAIEFSGYESPLYDATQPAELNFKALTLHKKYIAALSKGDKKTAQAALNEMKDLGIRSSRITDFGDVRFFGADPKQGKLKDGGLVGISHLTRPL